MIRTLSLFFLITLIAYGCGQNNETSEEAASIRDNSEEVQAFYKDNPDFFVFAAAEDLPKGLPWQDGLSLPDIGSPNAKKGGTYNIRLTDYPRTLRLTGPDTNGAFRSFISDYVRSGFANRHPENLEFYPGIANQWAISSENKTVYIKIDPAARWSDGKAITTEDVLFSFFFYRSKYIVSPWYNDYYTKKFSKLIVYDDLTFAIEVTEAKPDMDSVALEWTPMPRHFFHQLGDDYVERYQWSVVPTPGPYVVLPEDVKKGRSIAITRLDNWWAKDRKFYRNRFNFDKVRFRIIRDNAKAFEAFRLGEVDTFQLDLSEYWYDKLPDDDPDVEAGYIHKTQFYNVLPRPTFGLYLNESKPLLDNRDIRVGINFATNWELVIQSFFRDDVVRMRTANEGFGEFTHPTLQPRTYDIDKALAAFARAGFVERGPDSVLVNAEGQRLSFSLSSGYESYKDMLTILREEGLKAGVEFRIEVLSGTAGWKKYKKRNMTFISPRSANRWSSIRDIGRGGTLTMPTQIPIWPMDRSIQIANPYLKPTTTR